MIRALLLTLFFAPLQAATWTDHFTFETLPNPSGIDPQVGGMDFFPDGKLAVALHRGEVMIYDPAAKTWSLFASGLQEPLGLLTEKSGDILVMQRCELTRLRDTDGDAKADRYETVFDRFGMTGNYHEYAYGPVRDPDGNLFIALGPASNLSPAFPEVRGEYSSVGELTPQQMALTGDAWKKVRERAGRMFSLVPWRGWVLKISPDGKSMEPWASGFRSPDGLGFDAKGRFLVTDNQGDWRPTSPLYEVKKDGFYGHPASLVWRKNHDGRDPLKIPVPELDAHQIPAAGYFPQGELADSPTQPVVIPAGAFPKNFHRQTLIGEMNQPKLVRVLEDEVGGVFQTALVPFLDYSPLGIGNHRLAFGPDGALYVGKTALAWAGGSGITRVKWNGKPFFAIESIHATPSGFIVKCTDPVDPATVGKIAVRRHTYKYHSTYGSPKIDETTLPLLSSSLADDGCTLTLEIGPLKERHLHFLNLEKLRSTSGQNLLGDKAWYHVVKAP